MSRAGRGVAAVAALLALAPVVGCSPETLPPPPPAPVHDAWPGCVAVGAFDGEPFTGPPDVGSVPQGFVAAAAVLCSGDERPDARGNLRPVDLERTATEIDPLLTYLGRPSEAPTDGACPAIGIGRPWLYLIDGAGRYLAPAIPTDACGLPLGWQAETSVWDSITYTDRVVRTR